MVSRDAMLQGLLNTGGGDSLLPFVGQIYGLLSTCFWRMSWGSRTTCSKAKVASKGTRSCPCCSSKGSILLSSRSPSGCRRESSFSHSSTTLTPSLHQIDQKNVPISCDRSSWHHCWISLNNGKTPRLWNRGGSFPRDCVALEEAPRFWMIWMQWCGRETQSCPSVNKVSRS